MKSLTRGKMWCYAIGQLGWSIISGLIGSWLVYFYQPNQEAINDGMISLIPQGRVVLGIAACGQKAHNADNGQQQCKKLSHIAYPPWYKSFLLSPALRRGTIL